MSKTKADRASDIYGTARENPYVQRLIEDDDLRDDLRDAFESAKNAFERATGNGKGPVKAVTSDKKTQKEIRKAAEKLKDANERFQKPKRSRISCACGGRSTALIGNCPWSAPSGR